MYNREEKVGREEERGRGEKHLVVMRGEGGAAGRSEGEARDARGGDLIVAY